MNGVVLKVRMLHLSAAGGLAALLLAVLLANAAPTDTMVAASSLEDHPSANLSNGNVITIGVGAAISLLPEIALPQVNAVQLAVDQMNAAGVAMISGSATNVSLTDRGYSTTFRVISRDDYIASVLPTYMREWLKYDRAAIVELDGFWGNWSIDAMSTTFTSLGGTITGLYDVASTDGFTETLKAVKKPDPDVIFYVDDNGNRAGMLSGIANSLGLDRTIGWASCTDNESVLADYAAQAGPAAEGDYALMFYRSTKMMPGYAAFNAAYQAANFPEYGDEAQSWGAFAYDAARIILSAIKHSQSYDPPTVRDAIAATTNLQGVVGTYERFDAKGDVIPQWSWMERYESGKWLTMNPTRLFLPLIIKS